MAGRSQNFNRSGSAAGFISNGLHFFGRKKPVPLKYFIKTPDQMNGEVRIIKTKQ